MLQRGELRLPRHEAHGSCPVRGTSAGELAAGCLACHLSHSWWHHFLRKGTVLHVIPVSLHNLPTCLGVWLPCRRAPSMSCLGGRLHLLTVGWFFLLFGHNLSRNAGCHVSGRGDLGKWCSCRNGHSSCLLDCWRVPARVHTGVCTRVHVRSICQVCGWVGPVALVTFVHRGSICPGTARCFGVHLSLSRTLQSRAFSCSNASPRAHPSHYWDADSLWPGSGDGGKSVFLVSLGPRWPVSSRPGVAGGLSQWLCPCPGAWRSFGPSPRDRGSASSGAEVLALCPGLQRSSSQ